MLYALDSLNALSEADVLHALGDPDPQVRRHGLRLSEPMLDKSAAVREKAVSLTTDTDPIVQFQLALSLGECRDASATKAIAYILLHDSKNRDITDAALTSIVDRAGGVSEAAACRQQMVDKSGRRTDSDGDRAVRLFVSVMMMTSRFWSRCCSPPRPKPACDRHAGRDQSSESPAGQICLAATSRRSSSCRSCVRSAAKALVREAPTACSTKKDAPSEDRVRRQ